MTDTVLLRAAGLIRRFEKMRLSPYRCPSGHWAIGYGNRWLANGAAVNENTPPITEHQSTELLLQTLAMIQSQLRSFITTSLNENEEAALLDLVHDISLPVFSQSTLRTLLNRGDYKAAAEEFLKWNTSRGRILARLVLRRRIEYTLFIT